MHKIIMCQLRFCGCSKYENYMRVHDIDSRLIPCNVETPAAGQLTEAAAGRRC